MNFNYRPPTANSDINPIFNDPVNENFDAVINVSPEMARRMEAMAVALRKVRNKDGLCVMLRLPWVAIHEMAKAAEDPAIYMKAAGA